MDTSRWPGTVGTPGDVTDQASAIFIGKRNTEKQPNPFTSQPPRFRCFCFFNIRIHRRKRKSVDGKICRDRKPNKSGQTHAKLNKSPTRRRGGLGIQRGQHPVYGKDWISVATRIESRVRSESRPEKTGNKVAKLLAVKYGSRTRETASDLRRLPNTFSRQLRVRPGTKNDRCERTGVLPRLPFNR